MTEPITPGGVDPAEAVVYPDPTSLESLQRRAGHCAGRPCFPRCGYCGSFRQCERCEAITAQLRAERERDEARAEVERLRAQRDAARARHTPDARMGCDDVRCGSCQEESWPCLTAVALGVTE